MAFNRLRNFVPQPTVNPGMTAPKSPAFWRRRAEEAHRDADKFSDPSVKETLLSIANRYEQMADLLEAQKLKQ